MQFGHLYFIMNGVNYDNWLNRHNPYDDEIDEQLEEHLEAMRQMDEEEDQRNYCDDNPNIKFHEVQPYL